MNLGRFLTSGVLAIVVTLGLLFLMHFLILRNMKEPENVKEFKIQDIVMPDRQIETKYDTAKPDKPEEPEEPPPDLPEPEFDQPDISPDAISMAPKIDTNVKIAGVGGFSSDGEYLPIVKPPPRYPKRALSRGIEGWVIVSYTVTTNGSVRDPVVVQGDPEKIFDKAALKAAAKYKYKPRVIDGEPVEVPGVRTKIHFKIAK